VKVSAENAEISQNVYAINLWKTKAMTFIAVAITKIFYVTKIIN